MSKMPEIPAVFPNIDVEVSSSHSTTPTTIDITVSIVPPDTQFLFKKQKTTTIVCVDVSGSMGSAACVRCAGELVDVGFSVLDITKQALNTIIECATSEDEMAIVVFNNLSEVVFPLDCMTTSAKDRAKDVVRHIHEGGGTNIHAGILTALNIAKENKNSDTMTNIVLLTDGQHSEYTVKKESIVPMIQERTAAFGRMNTGAPVIHTFGFGYEIDSLLLHEIADAGHGSFSFVPDSGMVGTAFAHLIANNVCVYGSNAKLAIDVVSPHTFQTVRGYPDKDCDLKPTRCTVPLNTLHMQQPRLVTIQMSHHPDVPLKLTACLEYDCARHDNVHLISPVFRDITIPEIPQDTSATLANDRMRLVFVDMLSGMLDTASTESKRFMALQAFLETYSDKATSENPYITDAKNEVLAAISGQNYRKWGRSYMTSLACANKLQRKNNFKDKSITLYGGNLFDMWLDDASDIFSSIPTPRPSRYTAGADSKLDAGGFANVYNNQDAGCFHESAPIQMHDGTLKPIREIKKGDLVRVSSEEACETAAVECVVEIQTSKTPVYFCKLSDSLLITAWHPVKTRDGPWAFPIRMSALFNTPSESVYNLVLASGHTVCVGYHQCITLGSGLTDSPVTDHPYFSSSRVVDDLRSLFPNQYEAGKVVFTANPYTRNSLSGLVDGINPKRVLGVAEQQFLDDWDDVEPKAP
jgi:Mg-chelatase subunit ChlD